MDPSLINKSAAGMLMNPILIVMKNKAPTLNSINLNTKAAHNRQVYAHMYVCMCIYVHLIVVTWARVVCLIRMPKARGPQAQGLRAYISGKSRVPMLQLLCNIFLASYAQAKSSVEL